MQKNFLGFVAAAHLGAVDAGDVADERAWVLQAAEQKEEKTLLELFPTRHPDDGFKRHAHMRFLKGKYESDYGPIKVWNDERGSPHATFLACENEPTYRLYCEDKNGRLEWTMNQFVLSLDETTRSRLVWTKEGEEPIAWSRAVETPEDDMMYSSDDLGEASFDSGEVSVVCVPEECTEAWHRDAQAFAVALGVNVATGKSLVAPKKRPAKGIRTLPPAAIASIMEFVRGVQLIHFKPNDKVSHATHGPGTVTESERVGKDTWVTVVFDNGYKPHPLTLQAASSVLTLTGRMTKHWPKLRSAVRTTSAFKGPVAKKNRLLKVPEGVIEPARSQFTEPASTPATESSGTDQDVQATEPAGTDQDVQATESSSSDQTAPAAESSGIDPVAHPKAAGHGKPARGRRSTFFLKNGPLTLAPQPAAGNQKESDEAMPSPRVTPKDDSLEILASPLGAAPATAGEETDFQFFA